DLNDDGQVDIVYSRNSINQAKEYFWIVTWNGQTGALISALDQHSLPVIATRHESPNTEVLEYQDLNGDGIKEIIGEWYADTSAEELSRIIYSWNGQSY